MRTPPRRRLSRSRERERRSEDKGAVMIAALSVITISVLLSLVSVTTAVESVNSSARVRKQSQSVGASEAGLNAELASIQSTVHSGNTTTLTCSGGTQYITVSPSGQYGTSGAVGAGNTASIEYYQLYYSEGTTAAAAEATTAEPCGGTITAPSGSSTWYLVIQSNGVTASSVAGTPSVTRALLQINSGVITGVLGTFKDAIVGYQSLQPGGNFDLSGGDTYTTGVLQCGASNTFGGNVFAYDPTPPADGGIANGACEIDGNAYVYGSLELTGGGAIKGNLYSTGSVSLSGGLGVTGTIYADGPVSLSGSTTASAIYSTGSVSLSGGTKVATNIWANGSYIQSSSTVGGNIYANGTMSMSGNPNLSGSLYSTGAMSLSGVTTPGWVEATNNITFSGNYGSVADAYVSNSGYTITPACNSYYGPKNCFYSLPNDFPQQSQFPTPENQPELPEAQSFPSLVYTAQAWSDPSFADGGKVATVYINDNNCSDISGYLDAMASSSAPPTVIQTTCAVTVDTLTLANNLAIFASGGFDFENKGKTGVIAAANLNSNLVGKPSLYAIVPSTVTPNGETPSKNCPSENNPNGDIWVASNVSQTQGSIANSVNDFFYTPDSFCSRATPYVAGKVYAGESASFPGGYSQTYVDVNPYGVITDGEGDGNPTPGTVTVESIQ